MTEEHESSNAPDETPAVSTTDVDMVEGTANENDNDNANDSEMPFANEVPEARTTFASYLMSPIVTLLVGAQEPTVLTAHQALLSRSPFFQDACKSFTEDGSVSTRARNDGGLRAEANRLLIAAPD
jgi:hypothetical protein